MKAFVIDLLKTNLSLFYYYHNPDHTIYVSEKADEIGRHENCSEKELALLHAAVLWHDTGFINTYSYHEEESCLLARQYLPGYGYPDSDIEIICGMIMATKIPQSPKNKLEEIIADADLEYLGTDNAKKHADALFKELQYLNPNLSVKEWNKIQIGFLQKHHYFTNFCINNREPVKLAYLNKLISEQEKE